MALTGREENELSRLKRNEPQVRRNLAEATANKASSARSIQDNLNKILARIRELEAKRDQPEAICKRCKRRKVRPGGVVLCDQCTKEVG